MRRVGIAGIAEQPEHLACCHLVAWLDAHAARLHVRIEGEASFSDVDDDIVAPAPSEARYPPVVTGLITERGVVAPNQAALARAFPERAAAAAAAGEARAARGFCSAEAVSNSPVAIETGLFRGVDLQRGCQVS